MTPDKSETLMIEKRLMAAAKKIQRDCDLREGMTINRLTLDNVLLTYNGITACLTEWSRITQIPHGRLNYRIRKAHWPLERAFAK